MTWTVKVAFGGSGGFTATAIPGFNGGWTVSRQYQQTFAEIGKWAEGRW